MTSKLCILAVFLFAPISLSFATDHPACPEGSNVTSVGGDGISYGWHQHASCIIADGTAIPGKDASGDTFDVTADHPACPEGSSVTSVGGDGISYGWHEHASCIIADHTALPGVDTSSDTCPEGSNVTSVGGDGISYGWHEHASCIIADGTALPDIDTSGDTSEAVEEPVESTIDGELSTFAGTWVFTSDTGRTEIRQINADGTYTVWQFVPRLEEYIGLDRDQIEIVLSFMDDELITAGYTQPQIDFLREPRECWVVQAMGALSGSDGTYLLSETIIDVGTATGSASITRVGDSLTINGDLYSPYSEEINLCSEEA